MFWQFLLAALTFLPPAPADTPAPPAAQSAREARETPVVRVVRRTAPAIVFIESPRQNAKPAVGTGVIVSASGDVLTCRHVIGPATTVSVWLADGTPFVGKVVRVETAVDLALVRVTPADGKPLPFVPPCPRDDLIVGETVIAIGHPFGTYPHSVTTGIVSATRRKIKMPWGDELTDLVQTDAAINPGSSGGPLLNINGELIGINSALRDGANGLGFAVSAKTVRAFLQVQPK